jgi:hypothetical protein
VATAEPGTSTSGQQRVYLDSSAYLCVLLGEKGWERISDETAGAERVSSVLLVLETRRNLTRLAREGTLKPAQFQSCVERLDSDADSFVLRDLTADLCASNVFPTVATPRSLDLAHLRTALWFHATTLLDRFVTLDGSQRQAAKELGLPV